MFNSLSINELDSVLNRGEWTLLIFSLVVVIGVVAEHSRFNHVKLLHRIGETLVVVGVLGELFGDGVIYLASSRLQTIQTSQIATLNNQAKQAELNIAVTTEKAARLGVSVRSLNDFVTDQERRNDLAIEELNRSSSRLNKARDDALAASAATKTALEEMERMLSKQRNLQQEIAVALAPRTLSVERQKLVTEATARYKGQRYFASISQGADDGVEYWESIYAALKRAGWVYIPSGPPSLGNPRAGVPIVSMPGVEIRVDPAKVAELGPAAIALADALHADGTVVATTKGLESDPQEADRDKIYIVIGVRVKHP